MTISPDAAHLACKKLWRNLGPGPWVTTNERSVTTDAMLTAIIEAGDLYAGDFPGAGMRREMLVHSRALSGERHDDGSITWTKADTFPESPEPVDWVTAENARIARIVAEDEAKITREWQLRKAAQEAIDAPLKAAEQANFNHRLHEAGVSPDQVRAIVREEIDAALERRHTAATNHDNGLEPEEVGTVA